MNNNNFYNVYKTNALRFRLIRRVALLFLCLSFLSPVFSQNDEFPDRPVPPRLVNDFSGIFEPKQALQLEKMLVDYNDSTSTQIAVITVKSLQGYDIADYTDRLAEKWGVGRKEKNNGVVILIKPKLSASDYGEVRISVGYGLEEIIPDAVAKRIVNQEMIPQFQEEKYYEGVVAAVGVVMDLASGKYTASKYDSIFGVWEIAIIISLFSFGLFLLILTMILSRKDKKNINYNRKSATKYSGSSDSFRNSDDDDDRGGGGSSSGGFGGFGGGSFGGGGASGRW